MTPLRTPTRRVLALTMAASAVLAACGGGGESASTTETPTTRATTTTTEATTTTTTEAPTTTVATTTTVPIPIAPLTGLPAADALYAARPALVVKYRQPPRCAPARRLEPGGHRLRGDRRGDHPVLRHLPVDRCLTHRAHPFGADHRCRSDQPAEPSVLRLVGWQPQRGPGDRRRQRRQPGPRAGSGVVPRPRPPPAHRRGAHADERRHARPVRHRRARAGHAVPVLLLPAGRRCVGRSARHHHRRAARRREPAVDVGPGAGRVDP